MMFTGQNIRILRQQLGLSMQRFAEYLGVSTASVYNWEAERHIPSRMAREKLHELEKGLEEIANE